MEQIKKRKAEMGQHFDEAADSEMDEEGLFGKGPGAEASPFSKGAGKPPVLGGPATPFTGKARHKGGRDKEREPDERGGGRGRSKSRSRERGEQTQIVAVAPVARFDISEGKGQRWGDIDGNED